MTKLDERGYPPGYVPGIWRCPQCGEKWSDQEQQGDDYVAWNLPAECGPCNATMDRIGDDSTASRRKKDR